MVTTRCQRLVELALQKAFEGLLSQQWQQAALHALPYLPVVKEGKWESKFSIQTVLETDAIVGF